MSRRASESDFRAQSDELRRLRQQNLISIRKNDKSIEAYRTLPLVFITKNVLQRRQINLRRAGKVADFDRGNLRVEQVGTEICKNGRKVSRIEPDDKGTRDWN